MNDGEPLRFKASFEVMPEIKVDGYKELRAEKPEISVTDEEVEQSLNNLREQHATFDTRGRPGAGRWRLCPGLAWTASPKRAKAVPPTPVRQRSPSHG